MLFSHLLTQEVVLVVLFSLFNLMLNPHLKYLAELEHLFNLWKTRLTILQKNNYILSSKVLKLLPKKETQISLLKLHAMKKQSIPNIFLAKVNLKEVKNLFLF